MRFRHFLIIFIVFTLLFDSALFVKHYLKNQTPTTIHSSGTAFFINKQGYLVTAGHVVGVHKFVFVRYKNVIYSARVIFTDYWNDIAFIQINAQSPFLQFQKDFKSGKVYIFGYAVPDKFKYRLKMSVGTGHKEFNTDVMRNVVFVTAKIYHGQSGGPIISNYGVVGVQTDGYGSSSDPEDAPMMKGLGTPAETVIRLANNQKIYIEYSTRINPLSLGWNQKIKAEDSVVLTYT